MIMVMMVTTITIMIMLMYFTLNYLLFKIKSRNDVMCLSELFFVFLFLIFIQIIAISSILVWIQFRWTCSLFETLSMDGWMNVFGIEKNAHLCLGHILFSFWKKIQIDLEQNWKNFAIDLEQSKIQVFIWFLNRKYPEKCIRSNTLKQKKKMNNDDDNGGDGDDDGGAWC